MPRKTNDKKEIIDKIEDVVNTIKNKVVKKESASNKSQKTTNTKKVESKAKDSAKKKTDVVKKASSKKSTASAKSKKSATVEIEKKPAKVSNTTKASAPKKTATKKESTKPATTTKKTTSKSNTKLATTKKTSTSAAKTNTKQTTSKKSASAKATKSTTKRKTTKKVAKQPVLVEPILEYYDLPYRYNQTVVKILAQTPKMLFVYWDIADKDRKMYELHYGEDFFTSSRPVLIIHNETMNYSFELEINDFANSWYIHVNDANCKYNVELGRRPNHYITTLKENYVYISSSNQLDAPNDHILFEQATPNIRYKNVKNNQINIKDFSNSAFIKKILKTYSIKTIEELYEKLYEKNLLEDFKNGYYNNPTSNPSSNFMNI